MGPIGEVPSLDPGLAAPWAGAVRGGTPADRAHAAAISMPVAEQSFPATPAVVGDEVGLDDNLPARVRAMVARVAACARAVDWLARATAQPRDRAVSVFLRELRRADAAAGRAGRGGPGPVAAAREAAERRLRGRVAPTG